VQLSGVHHVQVLIPEGAEERARAFYSGLLGLLEVPKPAALVARGGCCFSGAGVSVHLSPEQPFVPATRAHLAIGVTDLDAARADLAEAGLAIIDDGLDVGFRRFYVHDPFGNRLELVERLRPLRARAWPPPVAPLRSARIRSGSIWAGSSPPCPSGPIGHSADRKT
jgi:catechol 2,3-dioxygenase-like lactoylglutathione lyase family enzyme